MTARLDYSKPPPGYGVAAFNAGTRVAPIVTWAWCILEESGRWEEDSGFATEERARDSAWAHYKAHNDPPGLRVIGTGNTDQVFDGARHFFLSRTGIGENARARAEARAAAWAWHDRRLALAKRIDDDVVCPVCGSRDAHTEAIDATTTTQPWCIECDVEMGGIADDIWPRCLTWTDEQVAEVERWLVDGPAEMPEVLRS